MNNIKQHTCSNGLQVITEFIPNVKTVALHWGIRAGVASNVHDGESVVLAELIQRGVLGFDAKQHNDALDNIGAKRHISCGVEFMYVSSVLLGNRLFEALPLLGAYLLSPTLPEGDLPACKSLCLQSISSISDNPSHLGAIELNVHHLPAPFNRSAYGTESCIDNVTIEQLRDVYKQLFIPSDSIVVIAGDVDHDKSVSEIEQLISNWTGSNTRTIAATPSDRGEHWVEQDSSQVHLSFAFDGPNATDEHSILESVAISVFGGASSGRLFTEVRQRRSLCYSVSAQYAPAKERSTVRIHAGTTPQRAEETVQVCMEQLSELRRGITKEEFTRTIQRMKSRTVMHGESTTARASALWGDQYALSKTRSLADRLQEIEAVKFDEVNDWLAKREYGDLTFVAVGPEEIKLGQDALQI